MFTIVYLYVYRQLVRNRFTDFAFPRKSTHPIKKQYSFIDSNFHVWMLFSVQFKALAGVIYVGIHIKKFLRNKIQND